jgi:hypothetical protein
MELDAAIVVEFKRIYLLSLLTDHLVFNFSI